MKRMTPLGALLGGLAAGLAGAVAQNIFFALTKKWAASSPVPAFEPPDPAQRQELPTQTMARRVVEGLARRGPIRSSALTAQVAHYAFGAAWGGAYGIAAESLAPLRTVRGGLLFGALVWCASDNVLLPLFRLSAWPQEYTVKSHAYALAAHLAYGASLQIGFEVLRRNSPALSAQLSGAWLTHRLPSFLRPTARRAATRGIAFVQPARDLLQVLR